jgi:hypothetical protein
MNDPYLEELPKYEKYRSVVEWLETHKQSSIIHKCMDVDTLIKYAREQKDHQLYLYVLENYSECDKKTAKLLMGNKYFKPSILKKYLKPCEIESLREYLSGENSNSNGNIDKIFFNTDEVTAKLFNIMLKSSNKEFILTIIDFAHRIDCEFTIKQLRHFARLFNIYELMVLIVNDKFNNNETLELMRQKIEMLNSCSVEYQTKQYKKIYDSDIEYGSDRFEYMISSLLQLNYVTNNVLIEMLLNWPDIDVDASFNSADETNNRKFLKSFTRRCSKIGEPKYTLSIHGNWNNICILIANDYNTEHYPNNNAFSHNINVEFFVAYTLSSRRREKYIKNQKFKFIINLIKQIFGIFTTKNMTKLANYFV